MLSRWWDNYDFARFSALQRAEIAEIPGLDVNNLDVVIVSVLFNEPKLLKFHTSSYIIIRRIVSVLFNEPKLLKSKTSTAEASIPVSFSALQRAEIAEIVVWFTDKATV